MRDGYAYIYGFNLAFIFAMFERVVDGGGRVFMIKKNGTKLRVKLELYYKNPYFSPFAATI